MSSPDTQASSSNRKRKALRQAMPEPNQTVLVHEPGPSGARDGSVVLGHRVDVGVASRLGLLAGLRTMNGSASLPDGSSPAAEDVQLWQAACVANTQPTIEELVVVLKVCCESRSRHRACFGYQADPGDHTQLALLPSTTITYDVSRLQFTDRPC